MKLFAASYVVCLTFNGTFARFYGIFTLKQDSDKKLDESTRRLGVMEEELKRSEERAGLSESNIKRLEAELKSVGENMKALEVSEEKALAREEKYKDQVKRAKTREISMKKSKEHF